MRKTDRKRYGGIVRVRDSPGGPWVNQPETCWIHWELRTTTIEFGARYTPLSLGSENTEVKTNSSNVAQ